MWYMNMCVHAFMCICMHACMRACIHVCTYMRVRACVCTYVRVKVHHAWLLNIYNSVMLYTSTTLYACPSQTGWHGKTPALPVFGDGENAVPTIHVHDLAR